MDGAIGAIMARRGLKNLVRQNDLRCGQPTWKLLTNDGARVPAFDYFCDKNFGYSYRTQKRYAEVVSRFIDYLFEAQALDPSTSASRLNAVIDAFPTLLRDGCASVASRIQESGSKSETWLQTLAEGLDWAPLAPNSFANTIAAVNRFLRLSESLAREANEKAAMAGIHTTGAPAPLIKTFDGQQKLSGLEIAALRQNSMFGNVAKFAPKGIQRARGLRRPGASSYATRRVLDFPREALQAVIDAADFWRDKCFWLLLGATGIRASEALNLQLEDVDFETQTIYVFDPRGRRAQLGADQQSRTRFKGRAMAYTFAIPELQEALFHALQQYLQLEFVPCYRVGEPAYLLQYVEPTKRGQPYVDASHAALSQSFSRALRAANVPVPKEGKDWVLHSLRHMYGVYMVNDLPVNAELGQYGLPLVHVQMMMGHSNIRSTAHYARTSQRRLEEKLRASDLAMLGMSVEDLNALPCFHTQVPRGDL